MENKFIVHEPRQVIRSEKILYDVEISNTTIKSPVVILSFTLEREAMLCKHLATRLIKVLDRAGYIRKY